MVADSVDLGDWYRVALESFLSGGGEAALERAYEVGRALITQGRGVVELADLHALAEDSVVQNAADATAAAIAAREANRFLAEALAPFEMTLRGFEELNKNLEQRVVERTKELEKAQAMFHQAQKMETIGRLAGGVAHDFNNLLSVMMMNAELALSLLATGDPVHAALEEILSATVRASSLTRQLLAFSRKQILAPTTLSLNDVVVGLEQMLRRLIGERVRLVTDLSPDVKRVHADKGQLEQVVMNLVVNARDAMQDGGTITVATTPSTSPAGDAVRLSVADTGSGIAPENVPHIFEPFFTTKPEGRGTGLGLATCYGIVRQSGGSISVDTELGKGTRFDVLLPAAPAPSTPASSSSPSASSSLSAQAAGRTATILVVDDDDAVRKATVRSLEAGGHTVLAASGGDAALALVAQTTTRIDLLLTDVAMPGMNGRELAEKLVARLPSVRVIYTSGHSEDEVLAHGISKAEMDFLQKPVRPSDLLAKIRDVLAR